MTQSHKHTQIRETRDRLLIEIRAQLDILTSLEDHNPLLVVSTSRAVLGLLEAYLSTLPPTYR